MSEGDPVEPSRIADLLEASVSTVVAELGALGADGGWRPEAGEWSNARRFSYEISSRGWAAGRATRGIIVGTDGGGPHGPDARKPVEVTQWLIQRRTASRPVGRARAAANRG